jgi:hypothetical protein
LVQVLKNYQPPSCFQSPFCFSEKRGGVIGMVQNVTDQNGIERAFGKRQTPAVKKPQIYRDNPVVDNIGANQVKFEFSLKLARDYSRPATKIKKLRARPDIIPAVIGHPFPGPSVKR